jgi:hypothetical protein
LWPDTLSGSLGEEGYEPMTATLDDVAKKKPAEVTAEQQAAVDLVRMAKEQGLSLTGPDGLLNQLTKSVIETALDEEMTEHLGYAKHDRAGIGAENIRNGSRPKTVLAADTGPVQIDARSRSTYPGIGRGPSSRRSSRNASAAWARSTRSSCPSMRRA